MRHLLLAATLVVAAPVPAQEPTLDAGAQMRTMFVSECVGNAGPDDDDAARARRFCACAFDVVSNGMTLREFIEMESAGHASRESIEAMPQYGRIKPALQHCKRQP